MSESSYLQPLEPLKLQTAGLRKISAQQFGESTASEGFHLFYILLSITKAQSITISSHTPRHIPDIEVQPELLECPAWPT